jgi:hypothetical protein
MNQLNNPMGKADYEYFKYPYHRFIMTDVLDLLNMFR